MDWPGAIETAQEIDIETTAGTVTHRTTIWSVVEDGAVYVRSLRGGAGRWYREVTATPEAVVHVGGEAIPVLAVPAPDEESVERASAGYRRKYAGSPYVETMTRPEILATTLRLEPR
jgi:hypothetical protein